MNQPTRALAALFAAGLLTTGCGGGGAGGDAIVTPSAPPAWTVPLAIDANNAAQLARLGPALGEAVLTVAQFGVDSARRFALPGESASVVTTCENGGLLTITLSDRDGNGTATAGDRITVEARDCLVPVITDIVTGTMQIDLDAPAGLATGGLRAAVALGDGLRFGSSSTGDSTLLGSLRFDWESTGVRTTLRVTPSASDDLRIVEGGGGTGRTEFVRQFDLRKTLKYDEARAETSVSYRYESQLLGGAVTVTTPAPLRAHLNTYPELGRIDVLGATGSRLVLSPNFVNNSDQYQAALDSNGDGTPESTNGIAWTEAALGYLWWDGLTDLSGATLGTYTTRPFTTNDFSASARLDWPTSSTSTVRFQFTRPPAGTTPALYFRFIDNGSLIDASQPTVDIEGIGEAHGALVIVRPATPFRHARHYTMRVSTDGSNWYDTVTIQDALGNVTGNSSWSGMTFSTPDNLIAVALGQSAPLLAASEQLLLDGRPSTGAPRPIVSYRWTQLSGTPLQFADATSAQTHVSWGPTPPTGIERAVVRLTVTDARGDTDATELTIRSADLSRSTRVLYFRSAAGDYIGRGAIELLDNSLAAFTETLSAGELRASMISPGFTNWWYLNLATSDGSPLQVGAYENAIRTPFRGSQNGLELYGNGSGCNQIFGRFDVLEIQTDATGTITRLAVDFEQHCEFAAAPPLLGSYRINSTVPIRR